VDIRDRFCARQGLAVLNPDPRARLRDEGTRAVNNLAVQALVAACAINKAVVDESPGRAAITEVTTE